MVKGRPGSTMCALQRSSPIGSRRTTSISNDGATLIPANAAIVMPIRKLNTTQCTTNVAATTTAVAPDCNMQKEMIGKMQNFNKDSMTYPPSTSPLNNAQDATAQISSNSVTKKSGTHKKSSLIASRRKSEKTNAKSAVETIPQTTSKASTVCDSFYRTQSSISRTHLYSDLGTKRTSHFGTTSSNTVRDYKPIEKLSSSSVSRSFMKPTSASVAKSRISFA